MSDVKDNNNNNVHSVYDGIEEQNNPMPGWWTWKFIFTVIFAVIYFIHYQIADGLTLDQELDLAMQKIEELKNSKPEVAIDISEESLLAKMDDSAAMNSAAAVYKTNCFSCHGEHLQGGIGPNLTDKFWLHGEGKLLGIYEVIQKGVPEKGMIAWDGILKAEDMANLAAFIKLKRNTNPVGAKKPEGPEIANYFD